MVTAAVFFAIAGLDCAAQDPMDNPPEIPILLLGDAGVGKSTFLSYVLLFYRYAT